MKATLLTVKEVREKLGLESNQGVHFLVEQGEIEVAERLSNGSRLFEPAEVERAKMARIKAMRQEGKDLIKRAETLRST